MVSWMKRKKMTQQKFSDWLEDKGILVSPGYISDVVNMRAPAGPRFKQVFKQITGISLVDGLVEEDRLNAND